MKRGLKKNSILDDDEGSDIFSQDSRVESSRIESPPLKKQSKRKPSLAAKSPIKSTKAFKKPNKVSKTKANTNAKLAKATSVKEQRIARKTLAASKQPDEEREEEEEEDDEKNSEKASQLDPRTVTIISVSEKISRKLAQHLWQELSPQILKSLQELILDVYIEPVVVGLSKSNKVRDRLRDLIQQLIAELVRKLANVKLPPMRNPNFLNLETASSKKVYLESVLSSNLKQIEILEKELIRDEKIYNNDLTYYNNLTKLIDRDELVKHISLDENLDHAVVNLKAPRPYDKDEEFENALTKLDKHLSSIGNNIKELTELNDKLEIVNDLLLLL